MKSVRLSFSPIAFAVFSLLASTAFVSGTALAATPESSETKAETDDSGLPLTKVTVDRKKIEEGAEQEGYGEAVKNVPGAMSNNGKGSANDAIRFRGLQLGLYSNYRLNGGLAITNIITVPTENKEKIEALKGANALMFGLASPAGILNMVTKRAGDKDISTVSVSGNDFGQIGASIDLARKLGDERQLGIRINASTTQIETGVQGIGGNGKFISLAADVAVTSQLKLGLDYERYSKDVVEQAGIVPPTAINGVIVIPEAPDPRKLLSGSWDLYTPRTENIILRGAFKLNNQWSLLAETGSSKSNRSRTQARITLNNVLTGDGKEAITFIDNQIYENTYSKAEVKGVLQALSLNHEITFGYTSAQRDSNIPSTYSPTAANNNFAINIYNPDVLPTPVDPLTALTYKPSSSKDSGVYLYDAFNLNNDIRVLAGLRQTDYKFSQTLTANGPFTSTTYTPVAKGFGVLYDIAPKTTLYSSFMEAMEDGPIAPSGPIQGMVVSNAFAILSPTIAVQKEVGLRSSYFNGMFFNVNYFDISKDNTNLISNSPTSVNFQYDGALHLYGYEFSGNAEITREWSVDSSAQFMKAIQIGGANDGKSTENTPETIVSASLSYRTPWVKGLLVRGGVSYVSSRFVGNSEQGSIPAVTLYSAGANYQTKIEGKNVTFQLGVENLANTRYWSSATSSAFGAGMDRSIRFSSKVEL